MCTYVGFLPGAVLTGAGAATNLGAEIGIYIRDKIFKKDLEKIMKKM